MTSPQKKLMLLPLLTAAIITPTMFVHANTVTCSLKTTGYDSGIPPKQVDWTSIWHPRWDYYSITYGYMNVNLMYFNNLTPEPVMRMAQDLVAANNQNNDIKTSYIMVVRWKWDSSSTLLAASKLQFRNGIWKLDARHPKFDTYDYRPTVNSQFNDGLQTEYSETTFDDFSYLIDPLQVTRETAYDWYGAPRTWNFTWRISVPITKSYANSNIGGIGPATVFERIITSSCTESPLQLSVSATPAQIDYGTVTLGGASVDRRLDINVTSGNNDIKARATFTASSVGDDGRIRLGDSTIKLYDGPSGTYEYVPNVSYDWGPFRSHYVTLRLFPDTGRTVGSAETRLTLTLTIL